MRPPDPYGNPANLYDLVYQWRDYAGHTARLVEMLDAHGVRDGEAVLEAACGTGVYLRPLSRRWSVAGFDLDPSMLTVARSHLPQGHFFAADLRDFAVDEPVGAVLALFGALAYVPPEHLPGAARSLRRALRPGGVAVVESWRSPERFEPEIPHMVTVDTRFLKVARVVVPKRMGGRAVLDFRWLVARPGYPVTELSTRDELWLYTPEELEDRLVGAGLEVVERGSGFMEDATLWILRAPACS